MKLRIHWAYRLFVEIALASVVLAGIIGIIRNANNERYAMGSFIIIGAVTATFLIALILAHFAIFNNFEICLDNIGIRKKLKINIAGFMLFNSEVTLKWSTVTEFKWRYEGLLTGHHLIGIDQNGKTISIIISRIVSNRDKAIEYIKKQMQIQTHIDT